MTAYFLRSNTLAEPLVYQWYAWPMLIPPATLALTAMKSHISILRSYIQMPKMHEMAVRDPKMRGGPFMDFNGENKVHEVEKFLAKMQDNSLIELAEALIALNERLAQAADGHAMRALYMDVPDVLKGYVELVYDIYNKPHYRLLEGLLYRSDFYNANAQSIMLSRLTSDQRAFVLSTPRLGLNDELIWNIPFNHPDVDWFFSSRESGVEQSQLDDFFHRHFSDSPEKQQHLMSLFTQTPPKSAAAYQEDGVRIRYLGHACVLIETRDVTILIDPMISYGYETSIERFTYEDLPPHIDYVLLTHSHQDHVMFEHLLQLRYKIGTIVVPKNASGMIQDPSLKLMFKQLGFKHVIDLDEMESISFPQGEILGVPFFGEHGDLYIQSKLAYIIKAAEKTILFAADSDNIEPKLYEHLQQVVPHIDVMFLGMECDGAPMSWLYGALLPAPLQRSMDQSRRLNGSNCDRAMDIVHRFNCQEVYIYAMGQEPWLGYITSIEYTDASYPIVESNQFISICQSEGREAERLFLKKEIRLET